MSKPNPSGPTAWVQSHAHIPTHAREAKPARTHGHGAASGSVAIPSARPRGGAAREEGGRGRGVGGAEPVAGERERGGPREHQPLARLAAAAKRSPQRQRRPAREQQRQAVAPALPPRDRADLLDRSKQ